MVTGAGGSIGSELCRQILRFGPVQLVAFDISEFAMYRLNEELRDKFPEVSVVPIIGDVKDSLLLDQVMARYWPHIVFHAAAYKHVPLMEEVNAWQAVRNNVLGTYRVGARGDPPRRRAFRADLHRQGRQPDQRDGREQAPRGDGLPGVAGAGRAAHAVRDGALRQRARQRRQRDSEVPGADRAAAARSRSRIRRSRASS